MVSKQTDYTGQTLDGRYLIQKRLAAGGMGAIYLGRHIAVGRKVAIKFLHEQFTENDEVIKRFYREAQAAAAIAHKNIIDVWDVGVSPSGDPYLAMEYLEGESLSSLLRRTGPVSLPAACGILESVLAALGAAHAKGVVHRDLKPDNIFLAQVAGESQPVVKIIDFGISKFTDDTGASKITRTGSMLGTPAYMPPEQLRGDRDLDHRADLYAVGVILYQMLTGKVPFSGDHYNSLIVSVLTEPPLPPAEAFPAFPVEAETLVMRLLSKDPNDRPESTAALQKDILKLATREQQLEHLSRYATGITERQCAAGNLGDELPSGSKGAGAVLAELSSKPTPSAWMDSKPPTGRRGGTLLLIGAVSTALVAVIGVWLWRSAGSGRQGDDGSVSATSISPAAPPPAGPAPPPNDAPVVPRGKSYQSAEAIPKPVEITVNGAPEGAVLTVDGAPVKENPFDVPRSQSAVQLVIRAPGFEAYKTEVIPDKDRVVEPRLTPLTEKAAPPKTPVGTTTASGKTEQPSTKGRKTTSGENEKSKESRPSKLIRGERGIKFIRGFDD